MNDPLEDAAADLYALTEEHGPTAALDRCGLGTEEVESLVVMAGDDLERTAVLLHGTLLGLALGETRTRETA